jgi:hypothetical protein
VFTLLKESGTETRRANTSFQLSLHEREVKVAVVRNILFLSGTVGFLWLKTN